MSTVSNPYIFNIKNNYSSKAEINIAFTSQSWTSPGTYTWVAPFTGTVTVVVIGGGGGSAIARGGGGSMVSASGGTGGTSQFKLGETVLLQATGGGGASASVTAQGGGSYTGSASNGSGGSPNGYNGSNNRGQALVTTGSTNGNYGKNDYIGYANSRNNRYGSGGVGGYNCSKVSIISGNTYTIVVGSGGRSSVNNKTYTNVATSGAVGIWKE